MKCLEKDPAYRYASADHLATELKRFLGGESVLARRPPILIRLWRWCKRYPLAAMLWALMAGLSIAGPFVALRQNALFREAQQARFDASRSLYFSDINLAFQDWDSANIERCGALLRQHIPTADVPDHRGFEWFYLFRKWELANHIPVIAKLPNIESMALSHDETLLALGSHNGTVLLWDRKNSKALAEWKAHAYEVSHLDFSANDQVLTSARIDGSVRTWDVATQKELAAFEGDRCVVCSPIDRTIAFAGSAGEFFILADGETSPQKMENAHEGQVTAISISPQGSMLASIGLDARLRIWDLATAECLHEAIADSSLWCVTWSADGHYLATGDTSGSVRIWNSACQPIHNIAAHEANVRAVAFSNKCRTLATSGEDNVIRLWDVESGQEIEKLLAHRGHAVDLAFVDDELTLLSASIDGDVRAWRLSQERSIRTWVVSPPDGLTQQHHLTGPGGIVDALIYSPDGKILASAGGDKVIRIWDAETGRQRAALKDHHSEIYDLAFSPDGQILASAGSGHAVKIWRATP